MEGINEKYNYQHYDNPKHGIFKIEKSPSEYILPGGWVYVETEIKIIGETNDEYVTRFIESEYENDGDIIFKSKNTYPSGIHKSRFIKWVDSQLELFDN